MTVPPPPLWRRVERCSDLSTPPKPAPNETFIRKAHRRTRTHPSDAAAGWDADQMGFSTKRRGSWLACAA